MTRNAEHTEPGALPASTGVVPYADGPTASALSELRCRARHRVPTYRQRHAILLCYDGSSDAGVPRRGAAKRFPGTLVICFTSGAVAVEIFAQNGFACLRTAADRRRCVDAALG
jgi:hypothetical protein